MGQGSSGSDGWGIPGMVEPGKNDPARKILYLEKYFAVASC